MAQRATPQDYWRAKMQTQVSAPVDQPLPVQFNPPALSFPDISSNGVVILGIVAIVGLLGLFALLGTSGRCKT